MSGSRRRRGLHLLAAGFVATFAVESLRAQGFQIGTLAGSVADTAGRPIFGAAVEVVHQEQGLSRAMTTDAAGMFKFPVLPIGIYRIETTFSGFQPNVVLNAVIESDRTNLVRIQLTPNANSEITVEGTVPLVDRTSAASTSRVTAKEIGNVAVSTRSYVLVLTFMPGALTTNVNGSLANANTYLIDGVDVTDPATGFPGSEIPFDAIAEVSVYTAGASAEYGHASGGVVNVVTKSGTNDSSRSLSYLVTNDAWNAQNRTRHGVTGGSLARDRFDHKNGVGSITAGAPLRRDRAWVFSAYERADTTSASRSTSVVPEEFQERRRSRITSVRADAQLNSDQRLMFKVGHDDLGGIIVDAFGTPSASELEALTVQGRRASQAALQYTALLNSALAIEALVGRSSSVTRFDAYDESAIDGGAPHLSLADGRFYNGGALLGEVDRPRRQMVVSVSAFPQFIHRHHDLKAGVEWDQVRSASDLRFPNDRLYVDRSFDASTRVSLPGQRRDYASGRSESMGDIVSLYVRDKVDWNDRIFVEMGMRFEKQRAENDAGATTVDTTTVAPRLAATYALSPDGRSLSVVTAGRYYESVLQSFSDAFARRPPREIYDLFLWNGSDYVFSRRQESAGRNFRPNSGVNPTYVDEFSIGMQRRLGSHSAVGIRTVWKEWHDLIDDTQRFTAAGATREVVNLRDARRSHRGFEVTFDRRWSRGWHALGSYSFADVRGNHFTSAFTALGDFDDAMCRTLFDPSVGTIRCSEVNGGNRINGRPDYDRRHNLKAGGSFVAPMGPADLTVGILAYALGGARYSKTRTVSVLVPGTTFDAGPTYTYYYDSPGSQKLGTLSQIDLSSEVAFRVRAPLTVALRGEIFNVTDRQSQTVVNNTGYCADPNGTAACVATREQFGSATSRNSFQQPRSFRLTAVVRF